MGHKQTKIVKEKKKNISKRLNEENSDQDEEEEEEDDDGIHFKNKRNKKKKLKDFMKYEIKELKNKFLGFRCRECFKQLKLKINIKENQEKYILFECEDGAHSNESTLRNLLEKYRIKLTPDYKVIDDFSSERKKDKIFSRDYMRPEYFFICTECKTIFYTRNKGIKEINHQHKLIEYLYLGSEDYHKETYNPEEKISLERREYFNLDYFNYLNLKKKIKEQKKFYKIN